jgi:broad specificity phosphatase PhoE
MTRLILIRHGETDYTTQRRYCGISNPTLNNKGKQQAQAIAERLKIFKIDKIYSSDLKRACQTSKILFKNRKFEKLSDFREINFGIFEKLTYEEIMEQHSEPYQKWIDNPLENKIPQGEGLSELNQRVNEKLSAVISENKNKTVAIVTHGGPIRIILCEVLKYHLKNFFEIKQNINALNIIDYDDQLQARVIKMNDTSHLNAEDRGQKAEKRIKNA